MLLLTYTSTASLLLPMVQTVADNCVTLYTLHATTIAAATAMRAGACAMRATGFWLML
jgi:hypothetical protein